jgi:hypothetical protein
MRIFQVLQPFEWTRDGRVIGVYTPGLRYTCFDDEAHADLARELEGWAAEGLVTMIDHPPEGTGPASASGEGSVE